MTAFTSDVTPRGTPAVTPQRWAGNVGTVIGDGRVLKRGGALTGYDVAEVTRAARGALAGVLSRA